ncbi:decaprenylphospho-beta-D-erythro-pentofuranosid-2-ulose 2-reductase [Enemella sp. A6]|uniref:decaprenylphospho-beta-D-erythro-pentofuranosid- 2-ulose 2-reductase n=1 Tax=Enemella sp. A6 TaxID=3440152 RepID=UPI003EB7A569
MNDAFGAPQTLLLLGGTSDIALAIARRYRAEGNLRRVILAARPGPRRETAARELADLGLTVEQLDLEARNPDSHAATVDEAFAAGDVDVVVFAFGVLGEAERAWTDADHALEMADVNYTAPVHLGVLVARLLRAQGHGSIIALSSVAGTRIRRSNFVYGSTKAGMDGFFFGLAEALRGSGVGVTVVRPGFVKTKMTAGMKPAPLSVTADQVAEQAVAAARQGKQVVWAPKLFQLVMLVLRHVPQAIFRRLPF